MSALLNKSYVNKSYDVNRNYDVNRSYEAPINMQVLAEPIEVHLDPVSRSNPWARGLGTAAILWLALMVSGITLVYSKHVMRQKVYELQALQENWDQMQVEWHRMLLEQGTWGGLNRIEQVATDQLRMKIPVADSVIVVRKRQ